MLGGQDRGVVGQRLMKVAHHCRLVLRVDARHVLLEGWGVRPGLDAQELVHGGVPVDAPGDEVPVPGADPTGLQGEGESLGGGAARLGGAR